MDLEDLLYFGFIAGSIIYSFLRKRKKEGQSKPKGLSPAEKYAQYQETLAAKGESEMRLQPIIEPTIQKETARFTTKSSPLSRSAMLQQEAEEASRKLVKDETKNPRRELIFNMVRKKKPVQQFNLRDAIIYETILKRPEW